MSPSSHSLIVRSHTATSFGPCCLDPMSRCSHSFHSTFLWVLNSSSAGCSSCTQLPDVGMSPIAGWPRASASARPAPCKPSATVIASTSAT
eukprot:5274665-Pleurochrysis_carterae.AAC.1